jgi:hypothetical protein
VIGRTWLAAGIILCAGCGGAFVPEQGVRLRTIDELGSDTMRDLAARRIYFGHQSVGGNIMDGVDELGKHRASSLVRVVALDRLGTEPGGFFAHSKVGRNEHPGTKTDDFARLLDAGLGGRVDIAFHKYCYADIGEGTDVGPLFEHYRAIMSGLRERYPAVTFVHVTVPLMAVQSGWKSGVKKLLGRAPDHYQANFARERFNDRMRQQYAGREPLFDLAAYEALDGDGRPVAISLGSTSGRTLYQPLTVDGGHLNEAGRRRIAENLLVFLAELPAPRHAGL